MAFSPETFNQHIDLLTNPERGLVTATSEPDLFRLNGTTTDMDVAAEGIVVITGPSRAGKDSIIERLIETEACCHVKTATTRPRRESEGLDAYTWMRAPLPGEDIDSYAAALEQEYELLESDVHHNDVYGLPAANLREASRDRLPLLNTDTRGIKSLRGRLVGQYSLTSILVCPDSAEELMRRTGQLNHKALDRLTTAQSYLEEAPDCVDYILLNRTAEDVDQSIAHAAGQVSRLISSIGLL